MFTALVPFECDAWCLKPLEIAGAGDARLAGWSASSVGWRGGSRGSLPTVWERVMAARQAETHIAAAWLPGRRAIEVYPVACLGSPEVQVTLTFPYPAGRFGAPMGAGRVHG